MHTIATDPIPAVSSETEAFTTTLVKRAEEQGKHAETDHQEKKEDPGTPAAEAAPVQDEKKDEKKDKEKSPETIKKELSDQTKANLRMGRQIGELKRQNDQLHAQLKTISDQLAGKEPSTNEDDTKAQAAWDAFRAREHDSMLEAIEQHGEEFIQKTVYEESGPYKDMAKKNPWLASRVIGAEKPVHEVLAIVNEENVLSKFGRTEEEVLKKAKEILRPQLFKEFQTEMSTKDKKKGASPGLSHVTPAGGADAKDMTPQAFTIGGSGLFKHNSVI